MGFTTSVPLRDSSPQIAAAFFQRLLRKATGVATAVFLSVVLAGCFSSKPEAKVKGLWVVAEESSAHFWNRSLSFIVYYFDGKGNVGAECQKLWSNGWDTTDIGCYSTSGTYSIKDDVIAIETPIFNVRYNFKRNGDKLAFSNIGNTKESGALTLIKERPWETYKDTSRFIRNGKVDHSFFKGWMNPG